jgi:ubiquinol-cytochrome c reductase cytochrome c1 subunit
MKKVILLLMLAGVPSMAFAAGAKVHLDPVKIDLNDRASLQRGARIFVNYCLSCHSAAYMRYNRMGHDLGISDELIKENLLFAADKIGDLMKAVMPPGDAKDWFGVAPPDLSLITRSRSPKWVYTYMRSFYRDDKSPSGWNNTVFPNVAMPHVLYEWQGDQRAMFKMSKSEAKKFDRFDLERPGSMSTKEYDDAMRDLTNFLVYLGEPAKLVRYKIGVFVLLFLVVFLVFAYLLKKEYWKDIH